MNIISICMSSISFYFLVLAAFPELEWIRHVGMSISIGVRIGQLLLTLTATVAFSVVLAVALAFVFALMAWLSAQELLW